MTRSGRQGMKIVVPFSGSAASSQAVAALVGEGCEVVTLTLDLGQTEALDGVRARALEAGASRAHVIDARETFVRSCVLPAMQRPHDEAGVEALAEPLIARMVDDIAGIEGGEPAPPDTGGFPRNLLMRPSAEPSRAPEAEARLDVTLDNGVPVAVNDVPMTLVELIESLSLIGGQHGIGYGEPPQPPAVVILRAVYDNAPDAGATVRLALHRGRYTVRPSAAPSMVAQ